MPKRVVTKKGAPANVGSKATLAIVLVTSLFFVWGLTMNLSNGFNSPVGTYWLGGDTFSASLLQVAYFGAYFIMAIPATLIAKRYGYRGGIICGLALFVLGSLVTLPATNIRNYPLFLLAMFVIALGAASLEANCNPYITKLGDEKHESMRLNLAQSFNGIGSIVAPLILAAILNPIANLSSVAEQLPAFLIDVRIIYIIIAIVLALVLLVFVFFKLPEPQETAEDGAEASASYASVFKKPHFVLGVIALFLYVGIQTVGFAQVSDVAQKLWFIGDQAAGALTLTVMTILFTVGRFVSVPLTAKFDPAKLLGIYMGAAAICFFITFLGLGAVSVCAMVIAFLFMSIGYPTIFALSLKGFTGAAVKTASSVLVMSIVGGALIPLLTGGIAQMAGDMGIVVAMIVCVPCLAYCSWYGFKGATIGSKSKTINKA